MRKKIKKKKEREEKRISCPWRSVGIHQATSNLDIIDITMSFVDNGEEEEGYPFETRIDPPILHQGSF